MGKWIPDSYLDYIIDQIATSNQQCICSQQPTTYFNAVWPDLWTQDTVVNVGDLVHPPTRNGFIYECVTGGTTGSSEPGWQTTQDNEFLDNDVMWKCHENYALANYEMVPENFTKSDGDVDGRKLHVEQIMGVTTHTAGTVTHTALIDTATKKLHFVTQAQTTIGGDNEVEAGRTTIFFEFEITIRDPQ